MFKVLISVIIPIFNVEKYLERCIKSVLKQSYKNLEIILIDDGSTDLSGEICDEYALKYDNIRVVHKMNEGIGPTRNLGIKMAQGEYVLFVDSDDYIDSYMIEKLFNAAIKTNSEIACCDKYRVYKSKNIIPISEESQNELIIFSQEDALRRYLLTQYVDVVFWNKLVRRDIYLNIVCPNQIYEDVSVMHNILLQANRIVCVKQPLYYYIQRDKSITDEIFSAKMYLLKEAVDNSFKDIIKIHNNISKDLELGRIHWYIVIYDKMLLANNKNKDFVNELKSLINSNFEHIKKTDMLSKMRKVQYLLLGKSTIMYDLLYKIYYKINR